jgi:hypothetical protein
MVCTNDSKILALNGLFENTQAGHLYVLKKTLSSLSA